MALRSRWSIPRFTSNSLAYFTLCTLAFYLGAMLSACSQRAQLPTVAVIPDVEMTSAPGPGQSGGELPRELADVRQGPLLLERAIEEALRASPELRQIEERISAASEQVRQAESAFYPRLVVSEEYNVTDNPVYALMNIINQRRLQPTVNFNEPGQQQNYSSRIRGEWNLLEGGSRWFDRSGAMNRQRSLDAELQGGRNQLVSKVTETYYRWLQALGFIGVAEKALESAQTDERLGEARLRVEMALPGEVARLKARSAEAHGNLVSARTGVRKLQAALERLLARPIRPEEVPDPALTSSLPPPEELEEDTGSLVRRALDQRPEMGAVRSLIDAALDRVRSAQGELLPKLGANAQYQWDSEAFIASAESWMIGVQATWPLFEGGVTSSKIREARAHLKELEARGEQVSLDIALEVRHAVLAVREAAEKIQVAEERRMWAQKALDEVRNLYRNEMATVDSLLQAEVAWNQAEVSYAAALFEGKIAQALLKRSLGDFTETIGGSR